MGERNQKAATAAATIKTTTNDHTRLSERIRMAKKRREKNAANNDIMMS